MIHINTQNADYIESVTRNVIAEDGIILFSTDGTPQPPMTHRVEGIAMSLLERGWVDISVNGNICHCEAPAITIYPPNQLLDPIGESADKLSQHLLISPAYAEKIHLQAADVKRTLFSLPATLLTHQQFQSLQHIFRKIRETMVSDAPYKQQYLAALISTLFYDELVQNIYRNTLRSQYSEIVEQFLADAQASALKEREVAYYVARSSRSLSQLERVLRKETGKSALQWINFYCAERCKQELRFSSDNIAEVSRRLGFSSSEYFARFFRQQTGMSPTEYRKRIRKLKSEE